MIFMPMLKVFLFQITIKKQKRKKLSKKKTKSILKEVEMIHIQYQPTLRKKINLHCFKIGLLQQLQEEELGEDQQSKFQKQSKLKILLTLPCLKIL
jgi:hypothetical protein